MPKEVWGSKHRCESCGAKFYDLQRYPVICPSCGDHLEVYFKENQNSSSNESDHEEIELTLDSDEKSLKDDNNEIEDDVDDILDNDEDTVSLDEIKNITTEDIE